jgi:hypothetical protein
MVAADLASLDAARKRRQFRRQAIDQGRETVPAGVSSVNAAPPSGIGRHSPAKQNHGSPTFVNFHFDFGDFFPVNS